MLKNLKIGTRLIIAFGLVLVLLAVVGGYAIQRINSLSSQITVLVDDRMVKLEQANTIIKNINILARAFRNMLIDENKEHQDNEMQRVQDARKTVGDIFDTLNTTIKTDQGIAVLQKIKNARSDYIKYTVAFMDHIKAAQTNQAKELLLNEIRTAQKTYMDAVDELAAFLNTLANESGKEAELAANKATAFIAILLTIAIVLSIVLAIVIIRSITTPVGKASALAEIMARGDFTAKLDIDQKDEIGIMANALNAMAVQLGSMIRDIVIGVNQLTSSSQDLASISNQLSSSARDTSEKSAMVATATEEMSSNIQSVAAAMEQSSANVNMVASSAEEMTATVHEIAQSAEKARAISESAVKQSSLTSEKMAVLGVSARNIGRVTETITEISEQTNLLALNATIEAARAGEAGKGFAVVANEIKELARQTAEATVDIKNQISEMQNTTAATVDDIAKISDVITEINNVISGIATAVEEQSAASGEIADNISQASQGIAEVNENVAQSTVVIAEITKDIATITQQSNHVDSGSAQVQSSAQILSKLAIQLESLTKKFKI